MLSTRGMANRGKLPLIGATLLVPFIMEFVLVPDFYQISAHLPGYLMNARAPRRSGGSGSSAVRMCWSARTWTVR
jgi:hypothetical protein